MKGKEKEKEPALLLDQQRMGHGSHPLSYIYIYTYIHISIIYSSQNNPGMVHLATRNECMRDRVKSIHHIVVRTIKAV
jgi:hypothetical protein